MRVDLIIEDLRKVREEYAAQFNYDLDAMFEDLKAGEKLHEHQMVSLPSKQRVPKSEDSGAVEVCPNCGHRLRNWTKADEVKIS